MRCVGHLLIILCLLVLPIERSSAQVAKPDNAKRVALVIGNSAYTNSPALANPSNDANDVARAFETLGFQVIKGLDLNKRGMEEILQRFARSLSNSTVGVFFYAGHGLQVSGRNYMVPIDAKLEDAYGVDFELIRLDLVHRTMERASNTNILFVDACRDNPLARNLARAMGTRSSAIGRGLASMEAGVGTLISFSTQPGNVALDGQGQRNSPYAKALVKHVTQGGYDISELLIRVRRDVMRDTARRQVPWEHSALTDQFHFGAKIPEPANEGANEGASLRANPQAELLFWSTVKESQNPALIRTYLARYPKGVFAPLARVMINSLEESRRRQAEAQRKTAEAVAAKERKRRAEMERITAERRAEQAKEIEELRKALAEAKQARKTWLEATKRQAAAEKAAKEARRKENAAKRDAKAAAEVKVALAPSAAEPPPQVDYVTAAQRALKSLGCYTGTVDGQWGRRSAAALTQALGRGHGSRTPDAALLARLGKVSRSKCVASKPAQKSASSSKASAPRKKPNTTGKKSCSSYWRCAEKYENMDYSFMRTLHACGPTPSGC